jgi:putative hydrolase of HD superfamily
VSDATGLARLLAVAGRLKRLRRTGWLDRGLPPAEGETVAAHLYRTALLAWLAAAGDPALDRDRVLKLALIHDLAEAIAGDPAPYRPEEIPPASDLDARRRFFSIRHQRTAADRQHKRLAEDAAVAELTRALPAATRDELAGLWREYEAGATPEARFVKEADSLEAFLQSREYLVDHPDLPVWGFADMAMHEIHHPALTAIRDTFTPEPE